VDIDLTFLPIIPREETFESIDQSLRTLAKVIEGSIQEANVRLITKTGDLVKLGVKTNGPEIIIEPNFISRGTVYSPVERALSDNTKKVLEVDTDFTVKTLTDAELFAGKISAALNRQTSRDLFDVQNLLKTEGISDETRKAFIVLLISNNRPMNELLNAKLPDPHSMEHSYRNNLLPMMLKEISIESLMETRTELIQSLKSSFLKSEKKFLLTFKMGMPRYDLLDIENVEKFPAVRWKQHNINKMPRFKRTEQTELLADALDAREILSNLENDIADDWIDR